MSNRKFIVRPFEERDLNEWFRLRCLLWDETDANDHKAEMLEIVSHSDTQKVFVVESGSDKLAGFLEVSIRPFVEDCKTDHVGYLEGWFVEPEFRKNGIGRELVRNAEKWARAKGCTEMASDSEIGNDQSLQAHLKLGYEETSRLVHLTKDLL